MEKGSELKARLYTELEARGYPARLNYRYNLNKPVQGFKVVVLDVVVVEPNMRPLMAFYVGPDKKRRVFKYKLSRIPYLSVRSRSDIVPAINEFQEWLLTNTTLI